MVSRTASCSVATVTTPRRGMLLSEAPFKARLSDSVPPDVNTISRGPAPMATAILSLASSRAFLARLDTSWTPDELPNTSSA